MSNGRDPLIIWGHFSSSTFFRPHRLSSQLRPAPPHGCCCPWWSSHSTASPKMLGSPVEMAAPSSIASPGISPRFHTSTSLHGPFNPVPSTATIVSEAALSPMTFIDLSERLQLFSMTPSCFQNKNYLWDAYTLLSSAVAQGTTLEHSFCVFTLTKLFPGDFASVAADLHHVF